MRTGYKEAGRSIPSLANGRNAMAQKAMYQYGHFGSIKAMSRGETAEMTAMAIT